MSGPGGDWCLQFFRGSPIFWGVSNFSGGLQFFGGGVSPIFVGVSNFLRGSPIFQGGCLQFFGGRVSGIRSMFGRYASYWNAFLFVMCWLLDHHPALCLFHPHTSCAVAIRKPVRREAECKVAIVNHQKWIIIAMEVLRENVCRLLTAIHSRCS